MSISVFSHVILLLGLRLKGSFVKRMFNLISLFVGEMVINIMM